MLYNFNGDGEIRTHDPLLARQVLSQLSYTPICFSIDVTQWPRMSLVFDDRNVASFHLPISLFEIFRSLTSSILILEIIFNVQFSRYKYNLLRKLLWEIASQFSAFPPECFAFLFWIETVLSRFRGDREIRTLDPLLARQVLSQLSYAPLRVIMLLLVLALTFSVSFGFSPYGLKWTRTTDLTLIRRAL